jgi:hypothetical protein
MSLSKVSEVALKMPFQFTAQGSLATVSDQETIWSNRVKSALGTVAGERIMHSFFGTEIPFDEWNTKSTMENLMPERISVMFSTLFPTLRLNNLILDFDDFNNILYVTVEYSLPNETKAQTKVGIATLAGVQPIYEETLL